MATARSLLIICSVSNYETDPRSLRQDRRSLCQVRAFQIHNPGVARQLAEQLPESGIEGVDASRTIAEQHPCEPSRRGPEDMESRSASS